MAYPCVFLILRQYLILTLLFFSILLGVSFTQPAKAITQTLSGTWSVKAGMPTPREGLGAGAVGSKLYAIKGFGFFGDSSINQAYDSATNTWTILPNSPVAESEFGATAVGTRVYAIGGRTTGGATVSIYDTASNTWSFGAPMPTARRGAAAVAVGTTIYAIGGSAGFAPGGFPQYAANEAYDTLSNTWRILSPMPSPRSDAYAVAVSGKIYVIGGFSSTLSNSTSNFLSTIQAYDIASNTWSTLAPMPTARDHVVAGVCGSDIFVVGGATSPFFTATSVVEAYQIGTNKWVTGIAPMPTPRWEMAAAQIGNTLYVVGGGGFGAIDTNPDGTAPNQALTMVCPPTVSPSLRVSPVVNMGAKGGSFTVNLNVANVTNLFSANVFLTFDQTLLTAGPIVDSGSVLRGYCSATPGCSGVSSQSTSGPGFVGEKLSLVTLGNGTIQGFSGSGLVYSVTLTASKTVTGTSTIHIASDSLGNNNGNLATSQAELIPHFSVDGVFTDDGPGIFVSPVPNRLTIEAPGVDASNITVYSLNGFTGTVSLSLAGVPVGVNASLAQSTLLLTGASATTRLKVAAGPSAPSGNFTITVTGTSTVKSKTITNSASLLLTIPVPTPDFLLSIAPSQITIPNGGSGSVTVTISSVHGFKSPVNLTLQGLIFFQGITSAFTVNPVTPSAGGNASSTLKLFVPEGAFPTVLNLIIMATGGGSTHAATFTLSVSAFFINVFPQFLTLTPGQTTFSSVRVFGVNNFIGTVNLSTVGVPSGVTASVFPSTATLAAGNQSAFSTLTVQAGGNAKPGNSVIFVIGNSTTSFAVGAVGLQITDFSVALGNPDVTVPVTGSAASTVFLSSLNGFTGPMAISVFGVPAGVSVMATPNFLFLGANSIASVTLNIAASAAARAGDFTLTIIANSGPLTRTAPLIIHVTDFSATASPQTVSMSKRQTVNVTISIASLNGFSQPVTLSGTILGNTTGVTVTITPSTVNPAGGVATATLTISTDLKPTLGIFTVLVTASSGSLVHLVPITLTITK